MLRRLAIPLLVAGLAVACKRDVSSGPPAASTSPVPAPPTLIAEGALRDPDAFWGRLRRGGGAPFARMRETAAGALLAWAGADPSVAPLVSGGLPFHVALGDSPDGLAFAIAMKLADPASAGATLADGETATYRKEEADGMIRMVPRQEGEARGALALAGAGYLVVASNAADLAALGPYAARTLPTRPPPASSFELHADPQVLAGAARKAPDFAAKATTALTTTLRGLVPAEVDAGALAACFTPDFRDIAVMAGDLAEAWVGANADDARLDVVATLAPKPGNNGARGRLTAMHPASAGPLLEAPRDALAALFWSDAAEARTSEASTLGPCVGKALGSILGPGGAARFAELVAAWARGRGDWETASFVAKPGEAGLVLRAPVADGPGLSGSVRGFVDLASQPSVAEAIERLLPLRAGGVETIDLPRVGKAQVAMFPSHSPPSRDPASPGSAAVELAPPGMAWAVDAKEVDIGLGQSPRDLLALARPAVAIRTLPAVEHAVVALGAEATFAAVLAPPGCCKGAGPASAPLTLGWGRHEGNGRATLVMGDEVLGLIFARATAP